ncbi:hypothetical protein [Bacteroides muris (ex Fokt et al. 2023)]|uniref:Glycosyltransferase RgtA/B/C/D-like domain-containing protein n=1 Tax=Bacteroides muris (ex Fokt et al. 2023) TaxID=2937417 RepID=A0A9X2NRL0_9BACE|nr:hypothetical protein [Bacteroides muris (ex Fokt et al. 2023)]MCR6504415.1 hypothetical protein [Bacteroides muris (ex Fokt et al. 2023)]
MITGLSRKRSIECLLLVPVAVALVYCTSRFITAGCVFNGDFPLYLRQALCVWQGDAEKVLHDMQQMIDMSTYQRYSPVLYPWGGPLLLSVPLKCFGMDYQAFKITETVFFIGALAVFYLLFRQREKNGLLPLAAVILLGFNTFYLYFCNYVSCELFFLFFIAASLWGIHRCYGNGQCRSGALPLLLGVLLLFTAQIRTEGYVLFASLMVAQLRSGCRGRRLMLPYLSAALFFFMLELLFPQRLSQPLSSLGVCHTGGDMAEYAELLLQSRHIDGLSSLLFLYRFLALHGSGGLLAAYAAIRWRLLISCPYAFS